MSLEETLEQQIAKTIKERQYVEIKDNLAPLISEELSQAMKPWQDQNEEILNKVLEGISSIKVEVNNNELVDILKEISNKLDKMVK